MALLPTIRRSQLLEEISDSSLRVIKLIAPAGYGKTTLVACLFDDLRTAARVDLEHAGTPSEICRRVITALAPFQSHLIREDLPDRLLGLAYDQASLEALAAAFLNALPAAFVLNFDNAEAMHSDRAMQAVIERLVPALPADARLIICSRQNVLRLGRFAGPDRTRMLSARELRLTVDEIREIFSRLNVSRGDLDAIERFTQGWPIVVMMLFALARRGRLQAYLTDQDDVSDLYGYLASEVYATLPAITTRVLEALTAVPDASIDELGLLFPNGDVAQSIANLQTDTPFVTVGDGAIALHPAMREMIAGQIDSDAYRSRFFERLSAIGNGARAAQIAMLRDRPLDAARVLDDHRAPAGFWTPDQVDILCTLPEHVFVTYPQLWGSAMHFRASHDATATIVTGQRLLAEIAEDAPAETRIDLMSAVVQMLANRGHLVDAQQLTGRFLTHPALVGNALAATLHAFFTAIIAFYRGDPLDVARFQDEFSPLFLTSPVQQSLRDTVILASHYRLHGDYALERAAIERGVEIGRATKFHVSMAIVATYAAMSAWFWGDLQLFERYVAELETSLAPSLANGFGHFIDCARGRGATARAGSEKMDMRTYAWAIAATAARSPADRVAFAHNALVAAEQSGQRFSEILACAILAHAEPDRAEELLTRAERLAVATESGELIRGLRALRAGDATGTMFDSLFTRLRSNGQAVTSDAFTIDIGTGSVRSEHEALALSPRERELVLYLARQPGVVDGKAIARALWPESDAERALLSLRVTINRLRKRAGAAAVIVATAGGYSLGAPVRITTGTAGA